MFTLNIHRVTSVALSSVRENGDEYVNAVRTITIRTADDQLFEVVLFSKTQHRDEPEDKPLLDIHV